MEDSQVVVILEEIRSRLKVLIEDQRALIEKLSNHAERQEALKK